MTRSRTLDSLDLCRKRVNADFAKIGGKSAVRRREFITVFSGAAAAWPLAVRAQQPVKPVVGILYSAPIDGFGTRRLPFRTGLAEIG